MKRTLTRISAFLLAAFIVAGCSPIVLAKGPDGSYQEGEIIEFGSYPQTRVTDESIIEALNAIDASEHYYEGYYEGVPLNNMGDIKFEEDKYMMSYKDVEYNTEKYRGVKIYSYRPWRTNALSDKNFSFQDEHNYERGTWYWFKYEPLCWKIFDAEKGTAICDRIIDAQPYNSTYDYGSDGYSNFSTVFHYSNDFAGSQLCEWLNKDFLNTAFTPEEQEQIPTTLVDTCFSDGTCGSKRAAAISKKVVLLSYSQAFDQAETDATGYGEDVSKAIFVSDYYSTDYASIQGDDYTYEWWLSTPALSDTLSALCVYSPYRSTPPIIGSHEIMSTSCGVRPVISFNVSEDEEEIDNIADNDTDDTKSKEVSDKKDKKNGSDQDGDNSDISLVAGIAGGAVAIGAGATAGVIIKKKKTVK